MGGGSDPTPTKIDMSKGYSFAGVDLISNPNNITNADFSNVVWPASSITYMAEIFGIPEDEIINNYEMILSSIYSYAPICSYAIMSLKQLKNILAGLDYQKVKSLEYFFMDSLIVEDDETLIRQLANGLPLINNLTNFLVNSGPRWVNSIIDGSMIIIIDSLNSLNGKSINLGDIILGDSVITTSNPFGDFDITVTDSTSNPSKSEVPDIVIGDVDIRKLPSDKNFDLKFSNLNYYTIGNLYDTSSRILYSISYKVKKIGELNIPDITGNAGDSIFLNFTSLQEVGKFPMIGGNLNISKTDFNEVTLSRLIEDTENQGLQNIGTQSTLKINSVIDERLTQEQRDRLNNNLNYMISVVS